MTWQNELIEKLAEKRAFFDGLSNLPDDVEQLQQRLRNSIENYKAFEEIAIKGAVEGITRAYVESEFKHQAYPCTIIPTRYGGVYEGCAWAAFPCYQHEIPEGATDSDIECADWWADNQQWVGQGNTPNEAVISLLEKKAVVELDVPRKDRWNDPRVPNWLRWW